MNNASSSPTRLIADKAFTKPRRAESQYRACGLCQARSYTHWWRMNGYDIGHCDRCGLAQVLQDMSERELTDLYTQEYYEGANDMVYRNYLRDRARKSKGFAEKFDAICRENHLTSPGNCLEIGCAYGLFLAEARQRGWQVRGIEVSEHSANWARTRLNLDVDTSPSALDAVPTAGQDLVVMWDVIEHLKDPLSLLRGVRRVLKPEGTFVLSTGDVRSIGARMYGKRWFLISPPYHQFYFDRTSITRMLEAAGFTVRGIQSEGHPLDNFGRYKLMSWIAKREQYIGWRLDSGPIMNVTAATPNRGPRLA